jgi:hypothetical protein
MCNIISCFQTTFGPSFPLTLLRYNTHSDWSNSCILTCLYQRTVWDFLRAICTFHALKNEKWTVVLLVNNDLIPRNRWWQTTSNEQPLSWLFSLSLWYWTDTYNDTDTETELEIDWYWILNTELTCKISQLQLTQFQRLQNWRDATRQKQQFVIIITLWKFVRWKRQVN